MNGKSNYSREELLAIREAAIAPGLCNDEENCDRCDYIAIVVQTTITEQGHYICPSCVIKTQFEAKMEKALEESKHEQVGARN